MADDTISIQVWYGPPAPEVPLSVDLAIVPGTTLGELLGSAQMLQGLSGVDLGTCKAGIWGKLRPPETVLRERDRIEIYRPLIADPKDARRRRAGKKSG